MKLRIVSYNTHGLPWSNQKPHEISDWCLQQDPDVVCLQEVFLQQMQDLYSSLFSRAGFIVIVPRDKGFSFFPSGLLCLVKMTRFQVLSHRFEPFLSHDFVEIGANKGFQLLVLQSKVTGRLVSLINTHMQSTTVMTVFESKAGIQRILREQFDQMVNAFPAPCEYSVKTPTFVVGDFNCEASPHTDVRFFYPAAPLRKSTFPETGEDLDHIAWMPLQWTLPGQPWCSMDVTGPKILSYTVTPLPYSDHYPILVDLWVPAFPVQKAKGCSV
jgi:hypothetical protein